LSRSIPQGMIERPFPAASNRSTIFFRRTANKLAKSGNVRAFVMFGSAGEPIGFYALNAHAVDYT
jgi:hypothetical protein